MQIHGGMGREQRRHAQESFLHDPHVQILLATDAAGEGINLQRAHLMVNYDLPWNPNRLEQRFGRIHRIGQTEVCHLWNLVAGETREGDVYKRLLEKLDQARASLGGQVFDVLGKVQFDGRSLRSLLIEAVRYGDQPEVKAKLDQAVKQAVDRRKLQKLFEKDALVQDAMDSREIVQARLDLERANARRLQPNYIESFFLEAFKNLGGTVRAREKHRYQISNVPEDLRNFVQETGMQGQVLRRYERIAFDKALLSPSGQAQAAFICPGHALLSSVIGLTLIRHGKLMKRGTVLVDDTDSSHNTRILFAVEHALRDGTQVNNDSRRIVSQRMLYVELDAAGTSRHLQNAPYLDYRPLHESEPSARAILSQPEMNWITHKLEDEVHREAVEKIVPEHFREVQERRQYAITKTRAAVHDRLHKEIAYWHNRAEQLRTQGKDNKARGQLSSSEATRRAKDLEHRLEQRMAQLQSEEQLFILPPKVLGGAIIVPRGLIDQLVGVPSSGPIDTQESAARARQIVMDVEKSLGYLPTDYEFEKRGYDIESQDPKTGKLRLIEVKGRVSGANTITVTKNEILTALNAAEDYILAVVEFFDTKEHRVHYIQNPFKQDPDWNAVSVNYSMDDLIRRAKNPMRAV